MNIISGYGEFESLRKVSQKDEVLKRKEDELKKATQPVASRGDTADVSNESRKLLMRDKAVGKLKQIPDPREEKVKDALEKLEKGTLLTPSAVKESIGRMLDHGIVF